MCRWSICTAPPGRPIERNCAKQSADSDSDRSHSSRLSCNMPGFGQLQTGQSQGKLSLDSNLAELRLIISGGGTRFPNQKQGSRVSPPVSPATIRVQKQKRVHRPNRHDIQTSSGGSFVDESLLAAANGLAVAPAQRFSIPDTDDLDPLPGGHAERATPEASWDRSGRNGTLTACLSPIPHICHAQFRKGFRNSRGCSGRIDRREADDQGREMPSLIKPQPLTRRLPGGRTAAGSRPRGG